MKRVLFFVLSILVINIAFAQPPSRFFTTFGGEGDDVGYSAKVTLDKHYIIAGSTSSFGNNNSDVYLVKLSNMGQGIWQKHIGGSGNEIGKAVIQLPDSGFVVTGFTNSFGAGGYDAYTIRTNKNGEVIWQKTFGGTDWDFANDLVLGSDGNIFVVGYTESFGNGKKDGFILKYDMAGTLLKQTFIGGTENEELRSIIKTNDNYLATVGYTESRGEINGDLYFLKINLNCDTLFTKTIGGPYKDFANDVVQKSNNDYIFTGAKTFSINTKSKSYIYSFSDVGAFLWEMQYYSSSEDESVISLANSYHLPNLTGYLRNVPVPNAKIQGNIIVGVVGGYNYKVNSFGGWDDEYFYSIEGTEDGGYIITGSSLSYGSLGMDVFIMKHDSTCYNYTSIVDIKKESIKKGQMFSYNFSDGYLLEFYDNDFPANIQLFDITGKLIREETTAQFKYRIQSHNLPASLYILQVCYSDGRSFRKKFIVR